MKRGYTDQDLADFIDTYLARKYSRSIDQFFQGTVLTVSMPATGGFLVTLARSGETTSDGNTYQVGPQTYIPSVGDKVECMWRDAASAYVLFPVLKAYPQPANVIGTDPTITGTAPAVGAGAFSMQAGARVGTTSAGGVITIGFPVAFPNGLLTAVACLGVNQGNWTADVVNASCSKTQMIVNVYNANSNTVVNTQGVTINWIAIGF